MLFMESHEHGLHVHHSGPCRWIVKIAMLEGNTAFMTTTTTGAVPPILHITLSMRDPL